MTRLKLSEAFYTKYFHQLKQQVPEKLVMRVSRKLIQVSPPKPGLFQWTPLFGHIYLQDNILRLCD